MYAIMKIVGVSPEALGNLHHVLKNEELKTSRECVINNGSDSVPKKHPYAFIEDSKFNTKYGTYTVILKLNLRLYAEEHISQSYSSHIPGYWVYPPLEAFQKVLQAIDPDLMPSGEEKSIPTAETVAYLKDRQNIRRYEELLPDLNHLVGRKLNSDIINSETREIILPADRKITRTLLVRLCENICSLDFLDRTDSLIVPALKQARAKTEKSEKEAQ